MNGFILALYTTCRTTSVDVDCLGRLAVQQLSVVFSYAGDVIQSSPDAAKMFAGSSALSFFGDVWYQVAADVKSFSSTRVLLIPGFVCVLRPTALSAVECLLFDFESTIAAVQQVSETLGSLFGVGVAFVDQSKRLVWMSDVGCVLLGLTPDQVTGRVTTDSRWQAVRADGSDYPGEDHPIMRSFLGQQDVTVELMGVFDHASQQFRWLAVDAFYLPDPRLSVAFFSVISSGPLPAESVLEHYKVTHDKLTGAASSLVLADLSAVALYSSRAGFNQLGVVKLDVAHIRQINSSLGHGAGDRLLQVLADRILSRCDFGQVLVRSAGDEFTLLCPGVVSVLQLSEFLDELLASVSVDVLSDDVVIPCSLHACAVLSSSNVTVSSLLEQSAILLSEVKASGEVKVVVASDPVVSASVSVTSALSSGAVCAFYQPVVDVSSGRAVGFEALARVRLSSGKVLSAGLFISSARNEGLIVDVDEVVFSEVLGLLSALDESLWVGVNLSAESLNIKGLAECMVARLRDAGVDPSRLVVEITEDAVLYESAAVSENLNAFAAAGCGVWLDDFGTGFSSLSSLSKFPISGVKLDRSFCQIAGSAEEVDKLEGVVRGLGWLASSMGLVGVAEGIETREQAMFVRSCGWSVAQGFLYGRPLAYTDVLSGFVV